ncbi:hypothetical protein GCM10009738_05130 [Kitasatospora viridis]
MLIATQTTLNQPGTSRCVVSNPTGTPIPIRTRQIPDGAAVRAARRAARTAQRAGGGAGAAEVAGAVEVAGAAEAAGAVTMAPCWPVERRRRIVRGDHLNSPARVALRSSP